MSQHGSSRARVPVSASTPGIAKLGGHHWFVIAVCSMGWMFGHHGQQLFNLARRPAIRDLLGGGATDATISEQAGYATMIFIDRVGHRRDLFRRPRRSARTRQDHDDHHLVLHHLHRSERILHQRLGLQCVPLPVRSRSRRPVRGGSVHGGEVVPDRARPYALGLVQACSAIGNMIAALTGIVLGQEWRRPARFTGQWRYLFLAGAVPAPLALVVFMKLKEPAQWLKARAERSAWDLSATSFAEPRWRRNAIVGMLLAFSGVVGLWGIGFFSYDLLRPVLDKAFRAQGLTGAALAARPAPGSGSLPCSRTWAVFLASTRSLI